MGRNRACARRGRAAPTLRKGGIREENKHFEIEHDRFFLYPTFDHQRNDLVRESHMPGARRGAGGGRWPDNEPPSRRSPRTAASRSRSACASAPGRGGRQLPDHGPAPIDALSPYYIWTTDYAEKCLPWKRRHPMHVIVLRTYRIPRPVTVKFRPEYQGCRSWLEALRPPLRGHAGALGRAVRAGHRGNRGHRLGRRAGAGLAARRNRRLDQPPNVPAGDRVKKRAPR